jgi:hypothetical protein
MACVRWSSGSRTTRAPPPSNTNWHAGMTFGSALEFSLLPLKKRNFEGGTMREAGQRVRQAWLGGIAGGEHNSRPRVHARTANTGRNQRFALIACSPRSRPRHAIIAEWNARLPSVARQGQSCLLTVYAGVVGQGPSVWQGSNAPWRNLARPSDNRAGGPISRGIRLVTNCIEFADAASTT